MGKPSKQQIADAVIHSVRIGESDAEFDARIAGLGRLSDEELAEMGIFPPEPPTPDEIRGTGAARSVGWGGRATQARRRSSAQSWREPASLPRSGQD